MTTLIRSSRPHANTIGPGAGPALLILTLFAVPNAVEAQDFQPFGLPVAASTALSQQHQHPPPPKPAPKPPSKPPSQPKPPSEPQPPAQPPRHGHPQEQHPAMQPGEWEFMQDGAIFGNFNHQGGPRGGSEFKMQNWWMGMAHRSLGAGLLSLNAMLSLDPATVGKRGYREIFQVGEAVDGRPLVDRQHPHDLLMQLAAVWRVPLDERTGFTIAGAPVGEPALGPVAFMHRPSAAENPTAPLGHHKLDSTHIAMGVITAAIDRDPWIVETSLFHGREPDENRWDLMDPGALDSWSARVWYDPTPEWQFQLSYGFLNEPEEFEPGDIRRTTASASWFLNGGSDDFTAVTAAFGRNDKEHAAFNGFLLEGTRRLGLTSLYGRLETLQVETDLLLHQAVLATGEEERKDLVTALTIGAARDFLNFEGFEFALGGDVTFYGVPQVLEATHGLHPTSFHIFVRVRPPAPMGRMWNMVMTQPMRGHGMEGHDMPGHEMGRPNP